MGKYDDCEKNGYHDWQVQGVSGTIPDEVVELFCDRCEATAEARVEDIEEPMEDDEDG